MRMFILLTVCCSASLTASEPKVALRERWEAPYAEQDATGPHVLGLWTFDGEAAARDGSPHQHPGTLQGAELVTDGRFGACLRSFRGWPVEDKRHVLVVPDDPALTPRGPFTIELWLNADETLADYPEAFLVDKKYVADNDYQLILQRADRDGGRTLQVNLGFGSRSSSWHSDPLTIEPERWYHVAFTYDAAGTGRFFLDGRLWGTQHVEGVGPVSDGSHPLSIGDRVGSYYHGFPGRIDQVRLTSGARDFRPARLERVSDRTCFLRMEEHVVLRFRLLNLDWEDIPNAQLTWTLDGKPGPANQLAPLASGMACELEYELDTALRPDQYRLEARVAWGPGATESVRETFLVRIVPRQPPDQFPVVMWGAGPSELDRLRQIGFTHALGIGADYGRIWEAGKPIAPDEPAKVQAVRRDLDRALAAGVHFAASLSPGNYLRSQERLRRVDPSGNPYPSRQDICGLFPEIGVFCRNVGTSVARAYGDLPAFQAALLHTEVRDAAQPCFHPHDRAACRAATGAEIPPQVRSKWGVKYQQLDGFPADRVIPDDDPLYRYYTWYWKQGDGWNQLNSQLQQGLDTIDRPDFWTWHDPAARVASVFGSGGDVDVISQWTYSYPDPIRIGTATDELLAMARGTGGRQQVMKMTQIIWYRSQTAPRPSPTDKEPVRQARWEREQPDAPFITIAPMHLREAFWTKIARPIRGIMYHGWQSLVPCEGLYGYRYTHPETQHELRRLIQSVIQPLGPSLRRIDGIQADVAYYESFAAQVFAGRGTYGWGGKWLGDAHQVVQWAGLQPEIVFDESIREYGLDSYQILFMMDCDVVTRSVAEKILQFQQRGGIVVGDENTAPAIKPDIVLPSYQRKGNGAVDKQALLKIAGQLRAELAGRYTSFVSSDNPEVIPYRRRYADTDYIFLINDHRQFGQYVGQHGRVMENGLPSEATITLRRPGSFVYDLVRGQPISSHPVSGGQEWAIQLGPGEGCLLMVTPRPIHELRVAVPDRAGPGEQACVEIQVVDPAGARLPAVIPLELTIENTEAHRAEFSGYWAAVDGQLRLPLDVASNETPGTWTIRVRELASGKTATAFLTVTGTADPAPLRDLGSEAANPVQPDG